MQYPGPDPFAPPHLPPETSPAARALGVLGIVFGSIVACADLLDLLNGAMTARTMRSFSLGSSGATPEAAAMERAMQEYFRAVIPHQLLVGSAMLLMSMALAGIGVGLFRQREKARKMAVVWSIAALTVLVARACLWEMWMWPRTDGFMKATTSGLLSSGVGGAPGFGKYAGLVQGFAHGGEYLSLAFLAVFPIVLLAMLRMPQLKEHMH